MRRYTRKKPILSGGNSPKAHAHPAIDRPKSGYIGDAATHNRHRSVNGRLVKETRCEVLRSRSRIIKRGRSMGVGVGREELVGLEDATKVLAMDGNRHTHIQELRPLDDDAITTEQIRLVQHLQGVTAMSSGGRRRRGQGNLQIELEVARVHYRGVEFGGVCLDGRYEIRP